MINSPFLVKSGELVDIAQLISFQGFAQLSSSHYRKVEETLKPLKTKGCFIHVDRAKADSKYHQSPVTVPGRIPPPQLSPQKF